MNKAHLFKRILSVLHRMNPHYLDRALTLAMTTSPTIFVREVLDRIRYHKGLEPDREDVLEFLKFAAPLVARSSSQFSQDLWALWESGGKRNGYFVEFGATNGKDMSNTYFLEKEMGWTGIVAEPNPTYWAALNENRSCFISQKCVYSRSGERLEFVASGPLSHIALIDPADSLDRSDATKVKAETISLNDLLVEAGAPKDIDFLSIDTEGSEAEILSHFDFASWHIRLIVAEHDGGVRRTALFDLLSRQGYRRKWPEIGHVDDWYVRV